MSMKLNKTIITSIIALGMSATFANAAAVPGQGKVTFTGSVVDAPCSINPDSLDQTIALGQISNAALKLGGKSTPRNFSIKLENCSFAATDAKNKVSVTFSGMESATTAGLLGVTGSATGVSVAITDGSGKVVPLGKAAAKAQTLVNGNNTLSYSAYVQGDSAKDATIKEGDFQAVADFTLAYN